MFVVNTGALLVIYALTAIFAREAVATVGPGVVIALVGNGATYIGGNVVYAWQRSRWYREELNEK